MSSFSVLKVTDLDVLLDVLDNHEKVVIDFSAPSWCAPCRQLMPHFHYASEALPAVMWVEVDIDNSPEIADRFNILSVPTVLLFENGELVQPIVGRTAVAILSEVENARP